MLNRSVPFVFLSSTLKKERCEVFVCSGIGALGRAVLMLYGGDFVDVILPMLMMLTYTKSCSRSSQKQSLT